MERKYCFYKKKRALHKVPLEGVVYLESSNNDVKFHTWDRVYLARLPFRLALDLLFDEDLVQVHRSFAVYLEHIDIIGSDTVTMHTKEPKEIPVSKTFRPKLMDNIIILEEGANGCGSECDSGEPYRPDDAGEEPGPEYQPGETMQGSEGNE